MRQSGRRMRQGERRTINHLTKNGRIEKKKKAWVGEDTGRPKKLKKGMA